MILENLKIFADDVAELCTRCVRTMAFCSVETRFYRTLLGVRLAAILVGILNF